MNTARDRVERKYQSFIDFLYKSAGEIDSLKGGNSQFVEIKDHFLSSLENSIIKSEERLKEAKTGTVWDNLVIAFFGETNAGKSTIIETFRILFEDETRKQEMIKKGEGVDGLIVGDGQADFTKVYKEYKLKVKGKPFTLIDVPGIEGNEDDFKDEIKKALTQAHCVFYVQGHNRQPDGATAQKIKKYLNNWVNVYSIYNVRGGSENYDESEERVSLRIESVCRVEQLIQETFQKTLGNVYKGNITIQGLLALCAYAQFSPQCRKLLRTQRKLLDLFGKVDVLFSFSRFNEIVEVVDQKSMNFTDEIVEANKQKLVALAKSIYMNIENDIDKQRQNVEQLDKGLSDFQRDIAALFSSFNSSVSSGIRNIHKRTFDKLQESVYHIIDCDSYNEEEKKKKIKSELEQLSACYSKDAQSFVGKELRILNEKIEIKKRKLDEVGFITFPIIGGIDINISSINFDAALDKMNISLGDVASFAASVGSGALAGSPFGGPMGAIIGGVAGGAIHLLRKGLFGDGGRGKAKEEVRQQINKCCTESEHKNLSPLLNMLASRVRMEQEKIVTNITREKNNLGKLTELINVADIKIKNFATNVKTKESGNI